MYTVSGLMNNKLSKGGEMKKYTLKELSESRNMTQEEVGRVKDIFQ